MLNPSLCDYPLRISLGEIAVPAAVPALTSRADKLAPVPAQAHDPFIQHRNGIQGCDHLRLCDCPLRLPGSHEPG
ncbi:hypothetical protein KKF97_17680 [Myxococcota bacterium]|nr:hypothetical protein [Myxococcota bacterium]MBU1379821.1 hypothetical protein [Myxococcota bacterium]